MSSQTIILYGVLASFAAGMMTTVGAIPCLFIKKISQKFEDTTLGFAAGVMLGASFFSLIVPGLDMLMNFGRTNTFLCWLCWEVC